MSKYPYKEGMLDQLKLFPKLALAFLFGVSGIVLPGPQTNAALFQSGDVFVGVSNGNIQHYDKSLNLIETLNTEIIGIGVRTTGMAFDSNLNLYSTNFSVFPPPFVPSGTNSVSKFENDNSGLVTPPNPFVVNDPQSGSESIVFDASGSFYVGQSFGTKDVVKYAADGTFLNRFDVAIDVSGSDWIDLAADQKTLFYTSEGRMIKRFDVSTGTQLTDFATLPINGGRAQALRLLGDGGILLADNQDIVRLDALGNIIQTYDVVGQDDWFALNLDPDGTSFWSANFITADLYKFDIGTGNILGSINTGTGINSVFGVAVAKEITQGTTNPGGGGPTNPVPEPTTGFLLGSGILGIFLWRWQSRKKRAS